MCMSCMPGRGTKVVIMKRVSGPAVELAAPTEAGPGATLGWNGPDLIVRFAKLSWKLSTDRSGFVLILEIATQRFFEVAVEILPG